LLESVKKWCAPCENDKTWSFWAENADLQKVVHFGETLKSVVPSADITKRADHRAPNTVLHKLVHFAKNGLKVVRQNVLPFSHWAHQFLVIFMKAF